MNTFGDHNRSLFRSPSPEPTYDNQGKRLNTREYRTRKKLEEQRHELVMKMKKLNESYVPPCDYKSVYILDNSSWLIFAINFFHFLAMEVVDFFEA